MKYTVGMDYGTLSARCVLVELESGREVGVAEYEYPHGVMDAQLPGGTTLGRDWALQHPQDYIDALSSVKKLVKKTKVDPADVVGFGLVFTACTLLPMKRDGTPLCQLPAFESRPNAYVKLWKHHAAQPYADRINQLAEKRGETFLARYGGKISSEWLLPKVYETLDLDEEVYREADYFIEAGDWLVGRIGSRYVRNNSAASAKGTWSRKHGFPSKDFLAELDPRLEDLEAQKLNLPIVMVGTQAGQLTYDAALRTGLNPGTPVAVAHMDGHGVTVGAGIIGPGAMLFIMGTSACNLVMTDKAVEPPGICGVAPDIIVPGHVGYEAGQSGFGDHFRWFVHNCVPGEYQQAAAQKKQTVYAYLTDLAAKLQPGQSGLLALDWWNGNRSVLVDTNLSGLMLGQHLQTKPEEMFRALLEATAFGTRMILENYEANGIEVNNLVAAGGIAHKNPLFMQIMASVTGKQLSVARSKQMPALSAAIWAALAAGEDGGGFGTLPQAVQHMVKPSEVIYQPQKDHREAYDELYEEYKRLHDYFGRGENDVMKRLRALSVRQTPSHT